MNDATTRPIKRATGLTNRFFARNFSPTAEAKSPLVFIAVSRETVPGRREMESIVRRKYRAFYCAARRFTQAPLPRPEISRILSPRRGATKYRHCHRIRYRARRACVDPSVNAERGWNLLGQPFSEHTYGYRQSSLVNSSAFNPRTCRSPAIRIGITTFWFCMRVWKIFTRRSGIPSCLWFFESRGTPEREVPWEWRSLRIHAGLFVAMTSKFIGFAISWMAINDVFDFQLDVLRVSDRDLHRAGGHELQIYYIHALLSAIK